jgi:hypothetical protein
MLQVQGKDRDKVAAVAKALELTDYIPRSYIEQVRNAVPGTGLSAWRSVSAARLHIPCMLTGTRPARILCLGGGSCSLPTTSHAATLSR